MSKKLVLMRPGSYSIIGGSLSEDGLREVTNNAQILTRERFTPDLIIHSPIKRAFETANLAREVFNQRAQHNIIIRPQEKLTPLQSSTPIEDILKIDDLKIDDFDKILIVPHFPNANNIGYGFNRNYTNLKEAGVAIYNIKEENWSDVSAGKKFTSPIKIF